MVSAVRKGILSSVSAYLIKFLITSLSFVPVSSNDPLIPISWQFNDIMLNTFLFVNTTLHVKIIKTGEAPLQGAAVLQYADFHKFTRETQCPD
jgi:hypothetical protein